MRCSICVFFEEKRVGDTQGREYSVKRWGSSTRVRPVTIIRREISGKTPARAHHDSRMSVK